MTIALLRMRAYLFSGLAVLAALAAKVVIQPHLSTSAPFITFLAAIMFVAWAWGLAPAVFATLFSAIVIDYSLIPPLQSFGLSTGDLGSVLFFCAVGLTMAYTIDRLETRNREALALGRQLEDLHRVSSRLFEDKDVDKILDNILMVGLELLDADKGLIQLYDRRDHSLRLATQVGFSAEFCERLQRVPLDFSCCGAAFQRRQRVIVENVATDTEFSKLAPLFAACHVVSAQSTPLFGADGTVLGVLTTYAPKPLVPSESRLHLFDLFAQQAARIVETRQQHESLTQEKQALEYQVSATEQWLQNTLRELSVTEERERQNLSAELHDYLAQLLTFASLKLHSAQGMFKSSPDKAALCMSQAAEAVQSSMMYTRTLMAELVPPELHTSGLAAALTWLARQMGKHGLTVDLDMKVESLTLRPHEAALLYRSVRELLINVTKHAATDHAILSVNLDTDQTLVIVVKDRGAGYDPAVARPSVTGTGFGLGSIRERMTVLGGSCHEQSAIGLGTTVTLRLPVDRKEELDSLHAASMMPQDRIKRQQSSSSQPELPFHTGSMG